MESKRDYSCTDIGKKDSHYFRTLKQKIQDAVKKKFQIDIPEGCFIETLDNSTSQNYLRDNPSIPFIIRNSNYPEKFALEYWAKRTQGKLKHRLFEISEVNEDLLIQLYTYRDEQEGVIQKKKSDFYQTVYDLLKNSQNRINKIHTAHELTIRISQCIQEKNLTVFSVQDFEGKLVALEAEEVQREKENVAKGVDRGHTGFTIAYILKSSFFVVRSNENRSEIKQKCRLSNDSFVIITAHGRVNSGNIEGLYAPFSNLKNEEAPDLKKEKIERTPEEIVDSFKDVGLKRGDRVTVLLCICYGGKEENNKKSFASILGEAFAKEGINSTIIASTKAVDRFGLEAIQKDNTIRFTENLGMRPNSLEVYSTQCSKGTSHNELDCKKISMIGYTIRLSENGLEFLEVPENLLSRLLQEVEEVRSKSRKQKHPFFEEKNPKSATLKNTGKKGSHSKCTIF